MATHLRNICFLHLILYSKAVAPAPEEPTSPAESEPLIGPGGRSETPEDRDRRLAINAKMRFHRSLARPLNELMHVHAYVHTYHWNWYISHLDLHPEIVALLR